MRIFHITQQFTFGSPLALLLHIGLKLQASTLQQIFCHQQSSHAALSLLLLNPFFNGSLQDIGPLSSSLAGHFFSLF